MLFPLPEVGSAGSLNGVFQQRNSFRPEGEPSKSVNFTCSTPKIVFICSSGFATVAEQDINLTWRFPTAAHILRSLLMMKETCEPNKPLYTCNSSTTTNFRFWRNVLHASSCGRMVM